MNYIDIYSDSGKYYGLYRIMPTETKKSNSDDSITYKCEHVLATLLDDVMEGYFQYTNYTTTEVLQYILSLQETKNWKLGKVDFTRYFHYSFENENGLLAPILSIPKPFNESYEFTFDTQNYPWTLNLIRPSDEVTSEIRWGKDMIDFSEVSDPTDIVNFIIPKGAGEGVNQLNIESVNNGVKYLKDDKSIAKWGKRSYIWIDRRFEHADSLKDNAQALLDEWKDPTIAFSINSVDLSVLEEYKYEEKLLNGVTRIIVEDKEYLARIIGEDINDLSKEYDKKYVINNKLDDIATTQADMERKQQVNEAYSQGATNILNFTYQDNCDNKIPAVIPFYIDDDVVNINTCELTFRTKPFRAYSRATEGGGATVKSTSAGGGTSTSTSSGGGSSETSGASSVSSRTSGASSSSTSGSVWSGSGFTIDTAGVTPAPPNYNHKHSVLASQLAHSHSMAHTHSINFQHTHSVSIPNHTHSFTVPAHTHDIELPDHVHDVKHEIVELGTTPNRVTIKVDGNTVPHTSTSGDRINLVDYMNKDSNGKISRGRHEVEILPNGLARIEADLILRVFIQSRLGNVY